MSSEDLKSLIVTDPSLVDEGIDVSGLRTQTDTNPRLLASIADYPGISYDPTSFSYLSDLNELFGYGLPLADTEAATPPATGTPETGDGGGGSGGGGGGGGSDPRNTAEEQRLIDAGIGLQDQIGDPVVAPGEIPVTKDELVEFNLRPVNTDFRNQQLVNQGIGLRVGDTGPVFAPGEAPVTQADMDAFNRTPGSNVIPTDPSQMLPQLSTDPFMVPGALGVDQREKQDFVTQEDVDNPDGLLAKLGITGFNAEEALLKAAINKAVGGPITFVIDFLKDTLPPQDPRIGALNELYPDRTSAGTISSGLMAGYNPVSGGFLNTITGGRIGEPTTFGLQEAYNTRIANVRESLQKNYGFTKEELDQIEAGNITPKILATGYNETMGGPTNNIQKLADLAAGKETEKGRLDLFSGDVDERDQFLDDYSAQLKASKVAEALGLGVDTGVEGEDEDRFIDSVGGGVDQGAVDLGVMDTTGIKGPPSIVESVEQKNIDLIDDFKNNISGITSQDKIDVEKRLDELVGEYVENEIRPDAGVVNIPIIELEAQAVKEKIIEIQDKNIIERGGGDDISTGGLDPNRGQQIDRGTSGAGDNQPVSTTTGPPSTGFQPQSTYDAELEDDRDVGGGGNQGGGGGKIVCTMMNESYGFGSFRNKIWLKHSKDLAPEYQIGYHKIFLPLVKLSKKNIVLKKVLEHIAVHRTIDIRQESRGKVHVLGRVYRKILEPICYLVGKYAS